MNLHNEIVNLGDKVYDYNRGYGEVVAFRENIVEIDFSSVRASYDTNGIQKGRKVQTLFWDKPYVLSPIKNGDGWIKLKEKFDAIHNLVKSFK
jgi:non-homologous end joining protein Ku